MSKNPADEPAAPELKPRTLDAWSWIARARQAAARAVEPAPPGPAADAVGGKPPERDAPAD
jgi:hypothetical protein